MKIIFLDVDGVLINLASCRKGFGIPDATCIEHLNTLLATSGAMIVVSSCWRIGRTRIELQDLLSGWNVKGKVLDRTKQVIGQDRGHEIQLWLTEREARRGDVESFVIIDDDADMAHLRDRLVQTKFGPGLTPADVAKALQILKQP